MPRRSIDISAEDRQRLKGHGRALKVRRFPFRSVRYSNRTLCEQRVLRPILASRTSGRSNKKS
jgi:hypothetical protein